MSFMPPYTQEQTAAFPDLQQKSAFGRIKWRVEDHWAFLTLNRPEKKNAIDASMLHEVAFALSYAHYENSIWGVQMQAEGDVFCSGADLKSFGRPPETEVPTPEKAIVIGDLLKSLAKPLLIRLHAPVMAGGLLWIAGATQVIAEESTSMRLPEVLRGIWPMQVMAALAEHLPARKVLDWCMRGYALSAREGKDLGLITELCSAGELDQHCTQMREQISEAAPKAVQMGLQSWHQLASIPAVKQHQFLQGQLMQILQSADAMEGIRAFKEKRKPQWTGN
jgi:enoyl-CoA hydratase/carnithine racemase